LLVDARASPSQALPPRLLELLSQYALTRDINTLHQVLKLWPNYRVERVLERSSRRSFLLFREDDVLLPLLLAVAVPAQSPQTPAVMDLARPIAPDDIARFARSGASLLRWSPP
jgi:hypothetical protein